MTKSKSIFSTKHYSLKEHDLLMENIFCNNSSFNEMWEINKQKYIVFIKKENENISFFWAIPLKEVKKRINGKEIQKTLNRPIVVFNGAFLKFLFKKLKEKPFHRLFIYFLNKKTLKDIDCKEENVKKFLLKNSRNNEKIDFIQMDSRLYSYFKLNSKFINKKSKLFFYKKENLLIFIIFLIKNKKNRIYGMKIQI